jgi:hypothetical protein
VIDRSRPVTGANSLHADKLAHFCLPAQFVASPQLHARFNCCSLNNMAGAFLCACLAMSFISSTFTPQSAPLLIIICAQRTFHYSLSCPISHCTPCFPYTLRVVLCSHLEIFCLDTEFGRVLLLRLAFGGTVGMSPLCSSFCAQNQKSDCFKISMTVTCFIVLRGSPPETMDHEIARRPCRPCTDAAAAPRCGPGPLSPNNAI